MSQRPLLETALRAWEAEEVRPLALKALECLDTELPPRHQSVDEVLQTVRTTPSLWALRLAVFLALDLTESFRAHVYAHSPHERGRLVRFLAQLRDEQWAHVRGLPPALGRASQCPQACVLTWTRLYLQSA